MHCWRQWRGEPAPARQNHAKQEAIGRSRGLGGGPAVDSADFAVQRVHKAVSQPTRRPRRTFSHGLGPSRLAPNGRYLINPAIANVAASFWRKFDVPANANRRSIPSADMPGELPEQLNRRWATVAVGWQADAGDHPNLRLRRSRQRGGGGANDAILQKRLVPTYAIRRPSSVNSKTFAGSKRAVKG